MAYDPGLVERLRDALARLGERGSRERGVFGGWGFLQGKSTFAIAYGDEILAKMPPDGYAAALTRPGVTPFAPDGERPMGTWVVLAADAIADDPELADWVALALQGVRSAPPPKTLGSTGANTSGARSRQVASPVKKEAASTKKGAANAKKGAASARKAASPAKKGASPAKKPTASTTVGGTGSRRKPGGRSR